MCTMVQTRRDIERDRDRDREEHRCTLQHIARTHTHIHLHTCTLHTQDLLISASKWRFYHNVIPERGEMCKTGEYKKVNALFCAYTPASCVEPNSRAWCGRITNITTRLIYSSSIRLNSLIHFSWIRKIPVGYESLLCSEHKLTLIITYGTFLYGWVFLSQGAVVTQLMTIREGEHCQ